MTALMYVNIALAGIAALLALALGVVYWRNHREIRSPFTMGLLLFALFLVVHNAILVYHFVTMMPTFSGTSEALLFAENALQLAALGALFGSTMR